MTALLPLLTAMTVSEQLGEVRTFEKGDGLASLNETILKHRNVLLGLGGDIARTHEAVEKMLPSAQETFRRAKSEARAEWVPGGDVADMEARYLLPDGSVRLGRTEEAGVLPDGTVEKRQVHGLLTDPYPVHASQVRARDAYTSYALACAFVRKLNAPKSLQHKAGHQLRQALCAIPGRIGEHCRAIFSDAASLQRAVANTATTGAELLSVPTLKDVRVPTNLARRIVSLVPTMEAPSVSFKPPIVTGRAVSQRRRATGADPASYAVANFVTSDTTVSIVDRTIMGLLDPMWAQDNGNVLQDPIGFIMSWLDSGDADSMEAAFLHGDTTATHEDTLATWTLEGYYTAGQLDGTNSPLKMWKGFRRDAVDGSATASAGGTFDAADHFGILNLMGNLAPDALIITGLACFYVQLLANSLFTSVQAFGALATLVTGELGRIGNTPLIISEFMPKCFDNTSGLYTGSNKANVMLYTAPKRYTHWIHPAGEGDIDQIYADKGAQYLGYVRRSVLARNCLSTEKPSAFLYNV